MNIPDNYIIKRNSDSDLTPEETLADSLSSHSPMEKSIGRGVFRFVYLIVSLAIAVIIASSYRLQIIDGEKYARNVDRISLPGYIVTALRGIVYDSEGQPLVENLPFFDLIVLHSVLPRNETDIENLISSVAPVIGLKVDDIRKIFNDNKNEASFVVKTNLSKAEVAKIKILSPRGLYVVADVKRHYPNGPTFANLLGYTAKVSPSDIQGDDYYLPSDQIGRLGLESYYEDILRGEHRPMVLKNDVLQDKYKTQPGGDIFLNVNASMQSHLYNVVTSVLASAGLRRGAAVVQDPKTGAVLALVSLPSFDNNVFENYSEGNNADLISRYLGDKNKPMFNRVISGRYSPGSTIKPLLALAGLKEKIVTPETIVNATGSITVKSKYDPNVVYTFNDWKVHGLTDIKKAIADSVDVFFYALGGGYRDINGLGAEKIFGYLKDFLVDKTLGIDLPGEISGFVPSEEWKKATKGEDWFMGDTYNISIGQGDLGVTPLWLNSYIGAIANGGNIMKPEIVKEIKNNSNDDTIKPEVLKKLQFDDRTMGIVKEGMRQAVLEGTAAMLSDLPVAAKTGTAQISGRGLNSLFVVYGPYDDPKIVMTVLIENVEGQGLAIKAAHDFLEWYFAGKNIE